MNKLIRDWIWQSWLPWQATDSTMIQQLCTYVNPLTPHASIGMKASLICFYWSCFSAISNDYEYLVGLQMALLALDKQWNGWKMAYDSLVVAISCWFSYTWTLHFLLVWSNRMHFTCAKMVSFLRSGHKLKCAHQQITHTYNINDLCRLLTWGLHRMLSAGILGANLDKCILNREFQVLLHLLNCHLRDNGGVWWHLHTIYTTWLKGFVIDEAHICKTWWALMMNSS